MQPSQPFSRLRIRSTALSLAILIGFACGPDNTDEFMSFFQPESSNAQPPDHRYFFTLRLYNDNEWAATDDTVIVDQNVRAWTTYAGGDLSETLVSRALYQEESAAVGRLKAQLAKTHPAAVTYLDFAWRVDNGAANPWGPGLTAADSSQLPAWLEITKTAYRQVSDPFLKERYAFQAVKLASITGDPQQTQQLYDELVKPLPRKTFISDYALSRRAGASLALGDTVRAIYEFAQVFDRCPDRRKAAELSLRKYSIHFDKRALPFAKTDHERAAVYALCAIQPGTDALPLLKQLVKSDPQNPLVELVMAREINRNEYYFFTDPTVYTPYGPLEFDTSAFVARKDKAPSYFDQLRSFALEAADNKTLNADQPGSGAFWLTAAAYLDFIGKDDKATQTHLDQAAALNPTNPALKKQIALQRMLLLSAQTETITPPVETQLISYLETFGKSDNFRFNNAVVAVCREFAAKYRQQEPPLLGGFLFGCRQKKSEPDGPSVAKAYLLTMLTTGQVSETYFNNSADQHVIEDTTAAATVRQVVAYATQLSPPDFATRLLKLTGLTPSYLNLVLGRRYMAEHQYAEAAGAFANVNSEMWQTEPFTNYFTQNPFSVRMPRLLAKARRIAYETKSGQTDSTAVLPGVDFLAEATGNSYTPVTFARRMAELEQQAKAATGDRAAGLYYQLGCGAWNLSWYGNAWLLHRAGWSTGDVWAYPHGNDSGRNQQRYDAMQRDDYLTTARAQAYFEQSAKAAKTPALADRSAYMAARCEQNCFSVRLAIERTKSDYPADDDPVFTARMRNLRQKEYARIYTDFVKHHTRTLFHDEMLRECGLYDNFLVFSGEIGLTKGDE